MNVSECRNRLRRRRLPAVDLSVNALTPERMSSASHGRARSIFHTVLQFDRVLDFFTLAIHMRKRSIYTYITGVVKSVSI
jgi:hypothetical protein